MTAESAAVRGNAFTRARLAFRRWRKSRPFWGGLFLILSGLWIFYSGNRDLGNLQVHLGLAGFQSYVIPLVLILCGALIWVTPDQRVFYGVIGVAVAIYSLIGANLGGFILGFLMGILGGALAAAWVPNKRMPVVAAQDQTTADETTADLTAAGLAAGDPDPEAPTTEDLGDWPDRAADPDSTEDGGARDPSETPAHPVPAPAHPVPAERQVGADAETGAETGVETGLASRVRGSGLGPGSGPGRTVIAVVAILSMAGIGTATFSSPTSAAEESCAPPSLQRLLESHGAVPPGRQKSTAKSTPTQPAVPPPAGNRPVTRPGDGDPLGGLIGIVTGLLPGSGPDPSQDPAPPPPSPSPSPDAAPPPPSPSPSPDAAPPSPSPSATPAPTTSSTPTGTPSPTGSGKPTVRPPAPTKTTDPGKPPTASPTCAASKVFNADGVGSVNHKPSKMTAGMLTMSGLTYNGIAELNGGSLKALWFSMSSSTSTPFELQPTVGDHSIDIKSSQLTVSGDVQFYCTSISGNLFGAVPVTFTVDSPPPLVVSEMFFTNATLQLAYVQSNVLTADALDITTT